MTFGPSVSRPVQWIGWAGLVTMLLLVGLLAACAQEQPVPEPQQPAPASPPPTAVPIDASPQTSRVAPLPAPTASLPPPTVAPTSMPSTQVPTPRPTRAPAITEATPSPTPEPPSAVSTQPAQTQQDQGTIQPAVSSVAIVWGDLFNELSSTEQDCLMTELGENQLSEIRAQPISPEEPQWAPAVFACLTPDTAIALSGAMLFALMVNEVLLGDAGGEEIPPEAKECIETLLADTDMGGIIAAALQDPTSGQMPNQAVMEFAAGIEKCAPIPTGALPPTGMPGPSSGEHPALPIEATLWQFSVTGWAMNAPTIADGTVYVGADDSTVYALDSANGGPIWTFQTGDVIRSPAVVSDSVVYAGSNDNMLYALDAATGDLLWQHDTGSPVQYAPLAGVDTVYVPTISEGGRNIYALDATSGAEFWVASQYYPFDSGWESGIGAALTDNTLLMIDDGGELHALSAQTGEVNWSFRGDVGTDTPPVVVGDVVYVTAVNTAYALDIETGTELWKYGTDRFPARGFAPVIVGGLYFFAPDDHTYALDTTNGNPVWDSQLDSMASSAPVVEDGTVYIASESGGFYALDSQTGEPRWNIDPAMNILESPTVDDGVLYLESSDGYLLALDALTAEELWGFNKGYFSGVRTYTVSDGVVYFSSLNGAIYAINSSAAAGR